LERGEKGAKNFPVFNVNEKLRTGEIKKVDIPYMQRNNGAWDNSDVVNKRSKYYKKWTKTDEDFYRDSNRWLRMSFFRNTTNNDKDMWERAGGKYSKKK
jgi:adenylate kinase family enzyme